MLDANEFSQRVIACERLLYHVAYTALGSAQECPDAVQDALLKAWKCRKSLRDASAFKSWIARIVYTACQDRLRKRPPAPLALDENIPFEQADDLPLQEALKKLPPDTRLSVVLYYLDGMSVQEVARAQNTNEGTIKSRLSRGRAALRNDLTEEE